MTADLLCMSFALLPGNSEMSPNVTRASGFTRFSNPSVRTFQFSDN
jgi:hypothetical protein